MNTVGEEVLVLSGVRTPVGRHGGGLSSIRPDDLLARVLRESVDRSGVDPENLEEVSVGIVNASGEAMGNVARYSSILAGLPMSVAGMSMNRFCGSGLAAFNALSHAIAVGSVNAGVAAGVESMSRSTWPILKPLNPKYVGPAPGARDAMFSGAGGPQNPTLEEDGTMIEMSEGAQAIAEEFGITRSDMDAFAMRSHQRAAAAASSGAFADEIVPVQLPQGLLESDETIRSDTSLERLGRLSPYDALAPDITAGNASPVSDGASALVLAAGEAARDAGTPIARVIGTAIAATEPKRFAIAPVLAIRKLLDRTGLSLEEVDLVEINEAFASQMIACIRELDLDEERVNVNGGALALGHALGNSGTRLTVTLLHEMKRRGSRFGIASLCIAAGQGIATLFERMD